jgi:hypothetical protein
MNAETALGILVFLLISAVIIGLVGLYARWVLRNSRAKTIWGVNLGPTKCPRCDKTQPRLRIPRNLRQASLGGWTCVCGCEMDKWGRERSSDTDSNGAGSDDH